MISPRSLLILPVGILAVAACSDSTAAGSASMTLSVANRSAVTSSASIGALADVTVTSGANTLVINKVQIVLGEIELKQASVECTEGSHSGPGRGGDDCPEVELDPVLVDVPLSGATTTLDLGALVPAGTYRELEFKIENVDDDSGAEAAFAAAHPELRGASVRVEGTYNGQPFVFKSNLEAEIELEFNSALTVSASQPLNLTLAVDVGAWFKGVGGTVLDPSNGVNALAIAANIRSSFAAFEDDDRDGVEDRRH